jgi:hypothetical protein
MTPNMKTLEDFKTLALAEVRSPDFGERLMHLFNNFTLPEARDIVERTNRFRGGRHVAVEKGAVGAAVVAAAMHHYFGQFDGRGFFDFQYEYWGPHGIDEKYPIRTMDILFLKPAAQTNGGSITFQVEAKDYSSMTVSDLTNGNVFRQVKKDFGYLNPRRPKQVPLVPVWWFLQGLTVEARNFLEAQHFRVVDFTRTPFEPELNRAFREGQ